MSKRYNPQEAEEKWQRFWQENNIHVFDVASDKEAFTIDTPPPTVSGRMHIGHAFGYAQQDYIARYHRMRGKNVYYPWGTDDNGLPTERLVEKKKKIRHQDYTREEFRKLCLEFVNEEKPAFTADWIRLGMSCDFSQSYSTIDEHSQKTSQKSFIDLFKKGLLTRKEAPVSWCTQCQTAIAQAEFESVDMSSHFNDLVFKVGEEEAIIATTRPELLPACVALCFNPKDERYQKWKGKFATVPLFNFEVPIITDDSVDLEKGTGLMMVCTFGDKEDIEKWHKHNLPLKIIFDDRGKVNDLVPQYKGLKVREMRKKVLEDLKENGALVAQKQITHAVNVHERCGTEFEFLKKTQWYVNVLDRKEQLLEAADNITWHPEHMKVRYQHWVENLGWDWCISRQRFYGVPFPVWYTPEGEIILADESQLPVDPLVDKPKGYAGDASLLVPETDVMDTWATSSVTPQIILNWAENNSQGKGVSENLSEEKKTSRTSLMNHYPLSLRPQGHDIIRTWAFATIVKSVSHHNAAPWKNIMINGHVLDPKGKKMSKSKGNVIVPQDVIGKFSADALRYWNAGVRLGDDMPYMEKDVKTGQKTVNKLANASKFVLMHLEDFTGFTGELEVMDKWLLSKLQKTIADATEGFENYEYSKARFAADKFFWQILCDQYLELAKNRLYNKEDFPEARASGQFALMQTLGVVLKLYAPIMPHITEEIYQERLAKEENCLSVHISEWPEAVDEFVNETAEKIGDQVVQIVDEVRKFKSENQLSLKTPLKKLSVVTPIDISLAEADLIAVTGAQEFEHSIGEKFLLNIEQ